MNRKTIVTATVVALVLIGLTTTIVLGGNRHVKGEITFDTTEPTPTPTPGKGGGPKPKNEGPRIGDVVKITMHHEDPSAPEGNVVFASGTLAGLGSDDIEVELQMQGDAVLVCVDHGGNEAPGQNTPPIVAEGSVVLNSANFTKNGTTNFVVGTLPATVPEGFTEGQCPNDKNWTVEIAFVLWNAATVTVQNAEGVDEEPLVLHFECQTFPDTDPPSEPEEIVCTEQP